MRYLQVGVFLPINNNGWIISTHAPQYMPTFELNKATTLAAEQQGFDFALSMIKWRGYGGPTQHWDHGRESFTLMAGLAAVTERIGLYASVATPTLHPAITARMAATIDDISQGRFGINIVTGWNKLEYAQMGLWPGDDYYSYRYDYATEYVQILKALWQDGRATYKGQFFELEDCLCQPKPCREIPIVCAGQSDRGMHFTAQLGTCNFIMGDIPKLAQLTQRFQQIAQDYDRQVGSYALVTVVAAETDQAAQALAAHYQAGGDQEALANWTGMAAKDRQGSAASNHQGEAFMGISRVIGSYQTVAEYFDRMVEETAVQGVLLAFPDFVSGVTEFGEQIMPRMRCRQANVLQPLALS